MIRSNNTDIYQQKSKSPIVVRLKRGSIVESIHKVHAVVSDSKGRILMQAGNPEYETFIRSALKPFQAFPFVSSGASELTSSGEKGIAIACSSHAGTKQHAREVFKILWNSNLEVDNLLCPIPMGRLSKLEHNCSGKHAAFLATCKKMNWPLSTYLEKNHPLQKEITRLLGELLSLPKEELLSARDDCGAPTYKLHLSQIAILYARLSSSCTPEFERINRAILNEPELIAGKDKFDTELMTRAHGQLLSKSGAEGIQCISRNGEGIGVAIKVEDGAKRAKHAVAIHLIKQLDWLTPIAIEELEQQVLEVGNEVRLEVEGKLEFQEN